jgi:flagellar biosynthetic protein FlhB
MSDGDDDESRSQAPSKRRRQQAREQGLVAHSPELTGAAALAAGLAALAAWGPSAWGGLLDGVRTGLGGSSPDLAMALTSASAAAWIRSTALGVAWPVGAILGTSLVAAVAAHQAQTRGLWTPSRLAPDLSRLASGLGGLGQGGLRAALGVVKAAVLLGLAGTVVWMRRAELLSLAAHDVEHLALASGHAIRRVVEPLALSLVVLGLADFVLRWRRVEAQLRMTPEQHREELKSADGDPDVRRRQRRVAKEWMTDLGPCVDGASLVVTAGSGLALVLAGDGPPGKIVVRAIARGTQTRQIVAAATRAGVPLVEAPAVAQHLSRPRASSLPPDLADQLAALWPRQPGA